MPSAIAVLNFAIVLGLTQGSGVEPIPLSQRLCSECTIAFSDPIIFDGHDSELTAFSSVARDDRGRLHVISHYDGDEIEVFGSDGSVVSRRGREGGGPGEYRTLNFIWTSGDTVFVSDFGNNSRLTVLDPDGRYVRSSHMPGGSGMLQNFQTGGS